MNLTNLTAIQLRRAATIKEQIERMKRELAGILGQPGRSGSLKRGPRAKKKRMNPATRAKLRARL